MSIDLKSMSEALEYVPSYFVNVLNFFWAKK